MSIGVAEDRIYWGTPKDLQPYVEAHRLRKIERDEEMWAAGYYNMCAVNTAVGKALSGRKSRAKYPEKPLLKMENNVHPKENKFSDAERFAMWSIAYNAKNKH